MSETTTLPATRSHKARSYEWHPETSTLVVTKGKKATGYALREFRPDAGYGQGRAFELVKADGTKYHLFLGMGEFSCDCPGKTYEAAEKADSRNGDTSPTLGCCHLDAIASLILAGRLPPPEGGSAATPEGGFAAFGPDPDDAAKTDAEWESAMLDAIPGRPTVVEGGKPVEVPDDEFPF